MSVYNFIYAATSDYTISSVDTTYSTARSGTGLVAQSNTSTSANCGQKLNTGTYTIQEWFLEFDTTGQSGSGTITLSLESNTSNGSSKNYEARLSSWTSGTSSWVAGASLSGLTLFASGTGAAGSSRAELAYSSGFSATASLKMLVCGADQTNNVAPTLSTEQGGFFAADSSGTTDDPYIQILTSSVWQLVGVSNVVEVTTASHALVTTGISGLQTGDLLVACISSRIASTTQITLPTGGEWTRVDSQQNNNTATNTSATPTGYMAYCVRGASDPNLTFTHPTTPSVAQGVILAYRNNATTSPLDTNNSVTSATNITAINVAAGVTTNQDDDLLVCLRAGGQESTMTSWAAATDPTTASGTTNTTSNPAPNAWIERVDTVTTTGADTAISVFDVVKTAAGSTGNMTGTASQASAHVIVTGAFKIGASSGAVTANPTGNEATGSAGTITVSGKAIVSITGVSATGSAGTPTVALNLNVPVTGVAATGSAGTPTVSGKAVVPTTGVAATGSAGNPSISGKAVVPITGVEATGSAGTPTVSFGTVAAVTGVEATGQADTPTVSGKAIVPITGVEAAGAAGTPTVAAKATASVSGVEATGQAGDLTVSGNATVPVTGVETGGQAGTSTVSGKAVVPVTGVEATGQVGTLSATAGGSVSASITGVEVAGQAGTPTVSGKAIVSLTGVSGTGQAGTPTVAGASNVSLTGVQSASAVNTPTVSGKANVSLDGVEATGSAGDVTASVAGSITVTLTGVAATGTAGTVSVTVTSGVVAVQGGGTGGWGAGLNGPPTPLSRLKGYKHKEDDKRRRELEALEAAIQRAYADLEGSSEEPQVPDEPKPPPPSIALPVIDWEKIERSQRAFNQVKNQLNAILRELQAYEARVEQEEDDIEFMMLVA